MNEDLNKWLNVVDAVYSNRKASSEAIFVHAWPDLCIELMGFVAQLHDESRGKNIIVLNSLEEYGGPDSGLTFCKGELLKMGVPLDKIKSIKGAQHTLLEARYFLEYAKEHSILAATVVGVPQHLLRSFMTDIGVMNDMHMAIQLYPRTLDPSQYSWFDSYTLSLSATEKEHSTRLSRFASECVRILMYRRKHDTGDGNYLLANIEETDAYIKNNYGEASHK